MSFPRVFALATALAFSACAAAQEVFRFTFDDIDTLAQYGRFEKEARLESPGHKSSKACIARSAESIYAQINFWLPKPVTIREGARMRFAHRVATEGQAKYIGIFFYCVGGQRVGQGAAPTGPEWQVSDTKIVGLGPTGFAKYRGKLQVGDRIERIQLYGRLAEKAFQTTYIDDWTLIVPGAEAVRLKPTPPSELEQAGPEGPPPPSAAELFEYDFETGEGDDCPAVAKASVSGWGRGPGGRIVSPGFKSRYAWAVNGNTRYLNLAIDCDFVLRKKMTLWFDHKVITKGRPLYVGIYLLRADGQKLLISNVPSNTEWEESSSKRLDLFGCDQKSKVKERGIYGERYTRIVLYSKLEDAAPQTLVVDNLKLVWEDGAVTRAAPHGACFRTRMAKTIDGRLDDWADIDASTGLAVGEAGHCHKHLWYLGPRDLSALVYVTHDNEFVYLAFVVTDDVARNTWRSGNQIHQGDCVLAGFAPQFPPDKKAFRRVYMFSPGDLDGGPSAMHVSVGGPKSAAKFGVARREGGYVVEARIPKDELGFEWQDGRDVGFEAMVYDSDERFGASSRRAIFTWASVTNRYNALECGRLSVAGPFEGKVESPVDSVEPATQLKQPFQDERQITVRAVEKPLSKAGLPVGIFVRREDLPRLRERIGGKPLASKFEILQTLSNLYLENCRSEEWTLDAISSSQAKLIEKYIVRLSLMYLLTEDPRFAELARAVALKAAASPRWPRDRHAIETLERAMAVAHDWLHNYLTAAERQTLKARCGAEVLKPAKLTPNDGMRLSCPEVFDILRGESAANEQPTQAGATRQTLEELRPPQPRRKPFDHNAPSPIRQDLLGRHPRTMLTPEQIGWIRAKASTAPDHIWKPSSTHPRVPPPPKRQGNSGGPVYWLPGLCLSYYVTGNDVYLESAKMVMRRLCEYRRWGGHNHLPADIDLDAGAMLFGLGIAYDMLHDHMMPSERAFVRDKLVRQARKMYRAHGHKRAYAYDQNHTYIDNGGLWVTAVALYDEVPEAKEWYDFGTRIIKKAMHCCNAGDGGFYEGVAYWAYGGGSLLRLLHLFENVTGEDVFSHYDCFKKTKYFLAYTVLPDWQHCVNMWDAGEPLYRVNLSRHWRAMLKAASAYRDAEAQGLAEVFRKEGRCKANDDAWTLLWWDPNVPAENPIEKWPPYHYFDDFDMVFIRSSWKPDALHFGLRCGPPLGRRVTEQVLLRNEIPEWKPGTGHVHPDINAFIIFNRGEHLAVDTGYTLRKWTKDHNTIAVDGGGQIGEGQAWPRYTPWDRYGKIGEFFASPGCYYYVRGEAARAYEPDLELARFDRHAIFVDPGYFVIFDELASTKPHAYEWICQSLEAPRVGPGNRFVITRGEEVLMGSTLLPQQPTMRTEDVIVEPTPWRQEATHRGKRVRVGLAQKARNAQFLTVLFAQREGQREPKASLIQNGDAIGAIVRWPSFTDTVMLHGEGKGLRTDGVRCFVRMSMAGAPLRWVVCRGTRLSVGGQTLVSADKPITCAWHLVKDKEGRLIRQTGRLRADATTAVTVFTPLRPKEITVSWDGTFDEKGSSVTLRIDAGEHEIGFVFL